MALVFDAKSLFDREDYSDVTIKIADRELKCHKIIICRSSKYFDALCGIGSKFKESAQSTIELRDDEPSAAETILLHCYGFDYSEITEGFLPAEAEVSVAAKWHIGIVAAAQKYLLSQLEQSAVQSLKKIYESLIVMEPSHFDASEVVGVLELLVLHTEHDTSFETWAAHIAYCSLPKLFKIQRFRELLDEDAGRLLLKMCTQALEFGCRGRSFGSLMPLEDSTKI